jgi:anti-sigma factor RsiW
MSMTDDMMTALERERLLWDSMMGIAFDAMSQLLERMITDGIIMLAEAAGLIGAQAPLAATACSLWTGPAVAASTATFGGAAAAGLAGLTSAQAIASTLLSPKFLKDGGIINKPTFVAGEAGAEVVGALEDLIPVFREAVYGPSQKRRTRIREKSGTRVDVGISSRIVGRGSRASQVSKTIGVL